MYNLLEAPRITRIDPARPDPLAIEEAARLLAGGELVVLPTETVYGLAAHPDAAGAIDRIYQIKGREETKAIPLLIADRMEVDRRNADWGGPGRALADRFWPGPLTLVLETPGGTVGFRMPDNAVALALLKASGNALAVTSANRSGQPETHTAQEAASSLGTGVALFLDAGPSAGKIPSTVVRIHNDEWTLLREGAVERKAIEKATRT